MLKEFQNLVVKVDHTIWYYLNTQWHNSFLDFVVPYLRNQYFWAPLYLFLLIFLPYNFGKRGWIWCVGYLLAFALSDQLVVEVIKPFFHRMRPCNNPGLKPFVHLVVECGTGFSFPSAHAANHFAMGVFMAVTLGKLAKWIKPAAITWAFLVSFAQVYVGVHFPVDVTVGALIGITFGTLVGKVFNHYFDLSKPPGIKPQTESSI